MLENTATTSYFSGHADFSRNTTVHPHLEKKLESQKEWSECLSEHYFKIIEYLDVTSLLPHLWQKHLLTPTERDVLDSMRATPHEQNRYLIKILPGKGESGFKRFLECLRNDKDHLGHEDLLKHLDHT